MKTAQPAPTLSWKNFTGARDGAVAIELALLAPILLTLLICTADIGMGVYRKMQVQNAAQSGAAFAVRNGFNPDAVMHAITTAAPSFPISATPAPRRFCGCLAGSNITPVDCTATCGGGGTPGHYVETSARGVYTTLIPYPLMDTSYTFNSQSTVRLQ